MTTDDNLAAIIKRKYAKRGETLTDAEADEAAGNLVEYFSILHTIAVRVKKLDRRLKTEPDGFPIDGPHTCILCGDPIDEKTGWYHKAGQRCLICHKAFLDGTIPLFILRDPYSHYRIWDLEKFGIGGKDARRFIKEGKLKARIVLKENGRAHRYIFLKKENKELAAQEQFNPMWKSEKRHRDKVHAAYKRKKRAEKAPLRNC